MSPLNQVSQIGGDSHFTTALELATGSTADHGYYLRTPVDKYPGKPQQEANNLQGGFEGRYTDNVAEFTVGNVPTISEGEPIRKTMCAWAPDAVVVGTNSPVEILATNSRGQRVQTQGDKLAVYELDNDIHAMAFPHGDGTYAWTLVLPRDDYKIQLLGTRAGPYELTLTTFDANGQPVQQVTHGETSPGLVEDFIVDAPDVAPHMPWDDEQGKSGGGGAMDAWLLGVVAALGLARVARRRRLTRYC
jgi:hypothetical protein